MLRVTADDIHRALELVAELVEYLHAPLTPEQAKEFNANDLAPVVFHSWTAVADLLAPLISDARFRELLADRIVLAP